MTKQEPTECPYCYLLTDKPCRTQKKAKQCDEYVDSYMLPRPTE